VSRRLFAALAATAVLLGASAAARADEDFASSGGTVVTVDGSVVTITVTIDLLLGGLGETELPEGAQADADTLAADIASYWNQGFERLGTACLTFRLVVVINALPMAEHRLLVLGEDRPLASVTRPGHHVVLWGVNNYGNAAPPVTYDPYDTDGNAPPGEDYGTPFEHELYAVWSPHLETPRDFAHEFGHLLGFGDDYSAGDEPLPGREGTLMDHGDLVDQNLANRLAALAHGAEPDVPQCETWAGTIESSVVTVGGAPGMCPEPIVVAGKVRLEVAPDGAVTGVYDVAGCGVTEPHAEFTGTATDDAFHFPELIVQTNGEPIPKVSPTEARATLRNFQGAGGLGAQWTTTWELACTTCG
jgi:hypothetical protein